MSCNCTEYSCLEVLANDCEEITVALTANETGDWVMLYEFNGGWKSVEFAVTNGERLLLPAVFNESYTHLIKFYNGANELVNDTCYMLNTAEIPTTVTAPSNDDDMARYYEYIVVSGTPSSELNNGRKEINAGSSITDSRLAGRIAIAVSALSADYNSGDFSKLKQSSTLHMTNEVTFGLDTVIRIDLA